MPATVADRSFDAVVFDWDGTAVTDRAADASAVRQLVEELCRRSVQVVVVSGTHVGNIDGQLRARPDGPGQLWLCLNRGSEVFAVDPSGPRLVWRRTASPAEDAGLDLSAHLAVSRLAALGLRSRIVSERLNRRKIDLIPVSEWADPPKTRIGELLVAVENRLHGCGIANLAEVVAIVTAAARDAGLADPHVTSDVKHVEVGLTDKSDAMRWVLGRLRQYGIGSGLIVLGGDEFGAVGGVAGSDSLMLVPEFGRGVTVSVGVEPGGVPPGVIHLGGGPQRWLEILDAQAERRRRRYPPAIDEDPLWVVAVPEEPALERVGESLATVANGSCGTRGSREEDGPLSRPLFMVGGLYDDSESPHLLGGPSWAALDIAARPACGDRRLLDLRTGSLLRERADGSLRILRFASLASPSVLALRADGALEVLRGPVPLDGGAARRSADMDTEMVTVGSDLGGGMALASVCWEEVVGGRRLIERLVGWAADRHAPPSEARARDELDRAWRLGFDRLRDEHRRAWAARWDDADVRIEGDSDAQLAVRFALFHLLSSTPAQGEAAVGARGLTGPAYGGHVFWDADTFVLPALAAICPGAARAMLDYRLDRLDGARSAASKAGRQGARFPWESAADGRDVTPRTGLRPDGQTVPILTGQYQEHITADVAWAAAEYVAWTGDTDFIAGPGRELIVETARYWASRITLDEIGVGHLMGVMGPDEYHEVVDDNAFTNAMARWNLVQGAGLLDADHEVDRPEATRWRDLARRLVDGYDPATGVHEQFRGFFALEPLLVSDVAQPPVAADLVLGRERTAGSQIIKQADVLMLHHLLPGEAEPGSLAADLKFYGPRTAHGSSLSPAIHASLLARAGQPDQALELFRIACRLDLDDLTGTTAGGLHLATFGGVWQALAYGFLGLRPTASALCVDPRLPSAWSALELRCRYRGARLTIRAEHESVTVSGDGATLVRLAGGQVQTIEGSGRTFALQEGTIR